MNLENLCTQYDQIVNYLKNNHNLIHCITNYVTVNDCANVILGSGAYPVMADEYEEVEDMVSHACSLVINIGTINESKFQSMIRAGKKANQLGIPVILDPVGASATEFRKKAVLKLISEISFSVIKGNYSEISFLFDNSVSQKGVDSTNDLIENIKLYSKLLSEKYNTVIVATGKVDVITFKETQVFIRNGSPLLSKITGTGCMLSTIIASLTISNDLALYSSIIGTMIMGISGELASESKHTKGLSSYKTNLIDSISSFSKEILMERGNISYELWLFTLLCNRSGTL